MIKSKLEEKIDYFCAKGKVKVGFGLIKPDKEILKSLKKSKKYADITLFGNKSIKNIKGFKLNISDNPEKEIASALVNGDVEGIVRGTIDALLTLETYLDLIKPVSPTISTPVFFSTNKGKFFSLAPPNNSEGWDEKSKYESVISTVKFLSSYKIKPKVGLITGIRPDSYKRKKNIKTGVQGELNKTFVDAKKISKKLNKKGILAKNYSVEVETAVEDNCNIILFPNGMVGNQVIRFILNVLSLRLISGVIVTFPHVFEDCARTEKDFFYHIKSVVAEVNKRKFKK